MATAVQTSYLQCCQRLGYCPKSQDLLSLNLIIIIIMYIKCVRIFIQYDSIEFNTLTKILGFSFNMVPLSSIH